MNRIIKFRAWDGYRMKYELYAEHGTGGNIEINDFLRDTDNLMQYTGIKDKNGKRIYESDIVKTVWEDDDGDEETVIASVKWDNEYAQFMYYWEDDDIECSYPMYSHEGYDLVENSTEIIGNIYENPELLN